MSKHLYAKNECPNPVLQREEGDTLYFRTISIDDEKATVAFNSFGHPLFSTNRRNDAVTRAIEKGWAIKTLH